ncbi:hypothetical protein AAZX31_12G103400 [Glycine max]
MEEQHEDDEQLFCTGKSVNFHHWSCIDHITNNAWQNLNIR